MICAVPSHCTESSNRCSLPTSCCTCPTEERKPVDAGQEALEGFETRETIDSGAACSVIWRLGQTFGSSDVCCTQVEPIDSQSEGDGKQEGGEKITFMVTRLCVTEESWGCFERSSPIHPITSQLRRETMIRPPRYQVPSHRQFSSCGVNITHLSTRSAYRADRYTTLSKRTRMSQ